MMTTNLLSAGGCAIVLAAGVASLVLPMRAAGEDVPLAVSESAARFNGQVMAQNGKPLAGARIYAVSRNDPRSSSGAVRAETDVSGRFSFDAPEMTYTELDGLPARSAGHLIAVANALGFAWTHLRGHADSYRGAVSDMDRIDVTLQLPNGDTPIRGRFLDSEGRPLAGARVRLTRVMIPMGRDLDEHLAREIGASLFSSLGYDSEWNDPGLIPGLATEARTDADGRFVLSGIGSDRLVSLSVSAKTVEDTSLVVMTRDTTDVRTRLGDTLTPPEAPRPVIHGAGFTVKLRPGSTIRGVVRDRDTGKPIEGMWVGIGGEPVSGLSNGNFPLATDAQGRFTITGLPEKLFDFKDEFRQVVAVSSPGLVYQTTAAIATRDADVEIECPRGIPFRLTLTDERGRPVQADEVIYRAIQPNPLLPRIPVFGGGRPLSRAALVDDGAYQGFVLPGPGAVLVKTNELLGCRPAYVDPKKFFAPGKTEWTSQEQISTYGNHDTLSSGGEWVNQHDYTAIVLISPPADSGKLELTATLVQDKPRLVSLIDSEGKPVVGVKTAGMTFHPYDREPRLRAASFPLTGLHPERPRRITYFEEDRRLIGFLMARGDDDAPYVVRMRPWGTIQGRLLDSAGAPLDSASITTGQSGIVVEADPAVGTNAGAKSDRQGRFHIDRIVPGQRYTGKVYGGIGDFQGIAFENLAIQVDETYDLGDIRLAEPSKERAPQ